MKRIYYKEYTPTMIMIISCIFSTIEIYLYITNMLILYYLIVPLIFLGITFLILNKMSVRIEDKK